MTDSTLLTLLNLLTLLTLPILPVLLTLLILGACGDRAEVHGSRTAFVARGQP
jgi:hypothetical protein